MGLDHCRPGEARRLPSARPRSTATHLHHSVVGPLRCGPSGSPPTHTPAAARSTAVRPTPTAKRMARRRCRRQTINRKRTAPGTCAARQPDPPCPTRPPGRCRHGGSAGDSPSLSPPERRRSGDRRERDACGCRRSGAPGAPCRSGHAPPGQRVFPAMNPRVQEPAGLHAPPAALLPGTHAAAEAELRQPPLQDALTAPAAAGSSAGRSG